MKGMIYKELRQSRIAYIFAALMTPLFFTLFIFVFSFIDGKFESLEYGLKMLYDSDSIATLVFMYIMGMAMVDAVSLTMFKADETKKWAYFISSTPVLPRGVVFVKYLSALVMAVIGCTKYQPIQRENQSQQLVIDSLNREVSTSN